MARFLAAFMLVGCAASYGERSGVFQKTGYSDVQLQDNVFKISFEGDTLTPRDQVSDYVLLHDADVVLAKGFPWFVVSSKEWAGFTMIHTIVGYREKPTDQAVLVYDAASVRKALRAKYHVKEEAKGASGPMSPQKCRADIECDVGSCVEGICR